jgi:hypothetical protein
MLADLELDERLDYERAVSFLREPNTGEINKVA